MGNISNVMEEFKKFILRGNIIDMAVCLLYTSDAADEL